MQPCVSFLRDALVVDGAPGEDDVGEHERDEEGYLDVISMFQAGIENVVASSGTSLTSEQVRLIHRFTNNVTVLYDGDAAGRHAALRGVDMLLADRCAGYS